MKGLDRQNVGRGLCALVVVAGLVGGVMPALAMQPPAAKPAETKPQAQPETAKPETKGEAKAASKEALPSGMDVINRYAEVTGGKAAYEKVKSRRSSATIEVAAMGLKGSMVIEQAAPNLMKVTRELPGEGKTVQGTDGSEFWVMSPTMGNSLVDGDERAQMMYSATFNPEINTEKMVKSAVTDSVEVVDGKECYKVVVTPTTGEPETRYYDKATGLLAKSVTVAKMAMGEISIESVPSEYKDVDGVKQPHKLTMSQMGMVISITFDKIEQNVEFPADHFAMPAEIKELKAKPAEKPADAAPAKTGEAARKTGSPK